MSEEETTCTWCGDWFTPTRSRPNYCSKSCEGKAEKSAKKFEKGN